MKKLGIICAYRKEETDLDATIADAQRSAGGVKACTVFAVEDKDMTGPGWNRHRGIEAAADCDVIAIIDAHMRFQGDALKQMAKDVRKRGGLVFPKTHHNAACAFEGWHSQEGKYLCSDEPGVSTSAKGHFSASSYYTGARIVWQADDHTPKFSPLAAKWCRNNETPTCVMGACYVFRREWYYRAGQPLSILRGWGCDEEALSIAAWMTEEFVLLSDEHVAHRYRKTPVYPVSGAEQWCRIANRVALCRAFIVDRFSRDQQVAFAQTGCNVKLDPYFRTEQIERLRQTMLKAPRSFEQWRREVCDDGVIQGKRVTTRIPVPASPERRVNPVVQEAGVTCPHCATVHADREVEVSHTYENGNRRRICPTCSGPFMSVPVVSPSKIAV